MSYGFMEIQRRNSLTEVWMLRFRIGMLNKPGEKDFHSQYLWYQGQFGELFPEWLWDFWNRKKEWADRNLHAKFGFSMSKNLKKVKSQSISPINLIIFKSCPFDIKEGTILKRPVRSFGHSVWSFGHLVIRPIQGAASYMATYTTQTSIAVHLWFENAHM